MNTFTSIIGYIILVLSILLTLVWCLRIRQKVRNEQATEKAMELQGFLMTVSILIVLLLKLSYFHLLWMIPLSFILGLISITTPIKILWTFSSFYFAFWYIGISNIGRQHYLAKEYDKAITAFKEEIRKKPSSASAYFYLGLAYGKIGEYEKEIEAYQSSVKFKPNSPEVYFNLGIVQKEKGDKHKAIEAFNEAIRLQPEYLNARYVMCKTYIEIGDKENAKRELEIIKKADSETAKDLIPIVENMQTN